MSTFGGIYFTNKGRALQAKSLTGVQLNFTRIAVGDGNLSGQVIAELTSLIHENKSLSITKLKTMTGGKATVGGILSNNGLEIGFYWRELGVFAQDPDVGEILYCYGNAAALAEYIPAQNGADILEKQINVVTIIGDTANVSATIDSSLVYATHEDIDASLIQAEQYTDQKVGAITIPVTKVNGKTGDIVLKAADINTDSGATIESQLADMTTKTLNSNLLTDIKGTTQNITFDTEGNVAQILHKDGSNNVIRTDMFDYSTSNLIVETRTLTAGGTLVYMYHLDTLQTEVI